MSNPEGGPRRKTVYGKTKMNDPRENPRDKRTGIKRPAQKKEWKAHWPKPPACSLVREGDTGKMCPECNSSLHYRFKYFPFFFKTDRCIQKDCTNYHVTNLKVPDRVRILRIGNDTRIMDWDEDKKQWIPKYTLSGDFDIELTPDFECNYPDCMIDKITDWRERVWDDKD